MRNFTFILAAIACFYFAGCDMINPHEQVPTYVHIDSFSFVPQGDTFGTSSHKITHVWVYVDNENIGAFTMPITFPVIADKKVTVRVAAGIDQNGLSGLKASYPFYAFDAIDIDPQPGKVVQFNPKTKYTSATRLLYNVNFDIGPPPFIKLDGNDSFKKTTDPNYVFEGAQAAYLYLDSNKKFSEVLSSGSFVADVGQQVFLELNYKCSIPFIVGLKAFGAAGDLPVQYFTGVNVREGWNKIYINVQDQINAHPGYQFFIAIRAGTDYEEANGWVAIDNVKVVAF